MTLIETLRQVGTATLAAQLLKKHGMRTRQVREVRPLDPARCRFVGPAVTLRYAPAREDLMAEAMLDHPANPTAPLVDALPEGAVLVVEMGGSLAGGALGDIMVARLIARGAAGLVVDGAMRDVGPVARMALPVFCRGAAAAPSFGGVIAVEAQGVIGCGGVLVRPGDIVCADADGVVVLPAHLAESLARDGLEQERMEAWIKARIEAGAPLRGTYPPGPDVLAAYRAGSAGGRA